MGVSAESDCLCGSDRGSNPGSKLIATESNSERLRRLRALDHIRVPAWALGPAVVRLADARLSGA